MSDALARHAMEFVNPSETQEEADEGVTGNSRLTAALGAVLFVAFAVEGVTLLVGVNQMFAVHIFVGVLVVPPVVAKIGTTAYRMVRYYTRDDRYRRKGPPHVVLRVIGPLVILSTVALLATGIGTIAVHGTTSRDLRDLHQTAFIVWVILMSVHVLGHLVETARLSAGDWTPRGPRVAGTNPRRTLVVVPLLAGVILGVLAVGWANDWRATNPERPDRRFQPGG